MAALKAFVDVDRVLTAVGDIRVVLCNCAKRTDHHHSIEAVDPTLGAVYQQCDPSQTIHQIYSAHLRSTTWDYQQTAPGHP